MESQSSQKFQIHDPYFIFHISPQQEEPIDLEKSIKDLIQVRNNVTQSINRLETKVSHLVNTMNDMNEKTLLNTLLIIPGFPNHIDRNQELWCLGDFNQD